MPPSSILFVIQTITLMTFATDAIPIMVINYYCPSLSIQSNATISDLYGLLSTKILLDHAITIIFNETVLLNLVNDDRNVTFFGLCAESNAIQIIKKPDFVALLEMVSDLGNNRNIPWLSHALHIISNPSVIPRRSGSLFTKHLHYDDNGNLIGVDLSNLNLIGDIHLESLPKTVRSLDLSFNDLNSLNLNELRRKSVERINIEKNMRCIIDAKYFRTESERSSTIKELQLSSNQIFPEVPHLRLKDIRIKQWLNRRQHLELLIVDGVRIYQDSYRSPFFLRMLRVIEGVTNKQKIPWYHLFSEGTPIRAGEWHNFGVECKKRRGGYPARYKFDLRGLGLEGHIDLGHLSRNIMKLDLSNNNLSSISFDGHGDGPGFFNLRELKLENNDNLRINLSSIDLYSKSCALCQLVHLSISSNQLTNEGDTEEKQEFVKHWLSGTKLKEVMIDGETFLNRMMYRGRANCSHCTLTVKNRIGSDSG